MDYLRLVRPSFRVGSSLSPSVLCFPLEAMAGESEGANETRGGRRNDREREVVKEDEEDTPWHCE